MIRNPGTQSVPETLTNPNLGTGQATCTETWFYSGSASGVEVERCATRRYARLAVELAADTAAEPGARLPHSCCGFASFTHLLTARADASIPWIWRLKPISIPFWTYPEPVLLIPGSQLQNPSPTFFCLCAHTHTHSATVPGKRKHCTRPLAPYPNSASCSRALLPCPHASLSGDQGDSGRSFLLSRRFFRGQVVKAGIPFRDPPSEF